MKKIVSNSTAETLTWAKVFARGLKGGEVISLEGDLGAGKTVVVKGIAKGLRVREIVNSPTFVLMKVYEVNKGKIRQLVHVDAYRLVGAGELLAIGLDDYIGKKDTVVLIEWGDKVKDILPKKVTRLLLKSVSENQREITYK